MTENNPLVIWLWALIATVAGSAASISFQPYKQMTWLAITLAFLVSCGFALFVGSAVAEWVATRTWVGGGPGQINIRVYGGVMWFMAASAHYLIPVAITRAKHFIRAFGGTEDEKE